MKENSTLRQCVQLLLLVGFLFPVAALAAIQPSPSASSPAATSTSPSAPANDAQATGAFVPLTQLPGIQDAANADTLPKFFNQLYKIAIGAGAVLAVIMIMIAGVQIMTSQGSVSSNEKAKTRIQGAVIGLILLLSPVIVFSIINPDILNLDLTKDINSLKLDALGTVPLDTPGGFTVAQKALWVSVGNSNASDAARCAASKATLAYGCQKKGGGYRKVSSTDQCAADETTYNTCSSAVSTLPTTKDQCTASYIGSSIKAINVTGNLQCNSSQGYVTIPNGCCAAKVEGVMCCAQPIGTEVKPAPSVATPKTPDVFGFSVYVVPEGKLSPQTFINGGPFINQKTCQDSLTAAIAAKKVVLADRTPLCTCSSPVNGQPGCPIH